MNLVTKQAVALSFTADIMRFAQCFYGRLSLSFDKAGFVDVESAFVYNFLCVCIGLSLHMCVYVHVCLHVYVCVHACVCLCAHVCVNAWVHLCMWLCVIHKCSFGVYMHACICTFMRCVCSCIDGHLRIYMDSLACDFCSFRKCMYHFCTINVSV